ncbi:bifunctional metallophosphatase/5'-nucleotidase [Aquibacillus sediminis]|uniref:bifunctional metallophosphatase/5'-nucleotidase n=1 Tax=Aquibacillus sediminis TaxID=2574734 RepID=UPI0011083DE1|nr:bifunctional UDP-sugar hydrolase/5'-nucleotidase [Aquibacillus sediminis]
MEEKLFFYYTNDLHSHFENWPNIVGFFKEKIKRREQEKQSYWLLDNGDHVDRFHPITEASMGKTNVQLLNAAGYDIATIGNNEGITLDYPDLYQLYDQADFQVVCANLDSMIEANPTWLKPTHQFTSKSGIKIGVIGLTAPFNAFYHLLGWTVHPPLESLNQYIYELKEETDIVILLSHLGIFEDEQIAQYYPEIDVIIGGHTHHLIRDGERIRNTLLTAAGKHGKFAGEVILTWDHAQRRLVNSEAYTTEVDVTPTDEQTEHQLQEYYQQSLSQLNQPVTYIDQPIKANWFAETKMMKRLVATLKAWTTADVAMLNAGLILDGLPAGKVSYGDIHRICPHPINPCVVQLSGSELLEVIRASYTKTFQEYKLKGFGFRGEVIGRMVYDGIDIDLTSNGLEEQVREVRINDEPIQPDKTYSVATADMFTFGKLLPEISRATDKQFYMPEFLRDLLVSMFENQKF